MNVTTALIGCAFGGCLIRKKPDFEVGLLTKVKVRLENMNVQQLIKEIGLSDKGGKCLIENGVSVQMLKLFTEGDIEDVFKGSFQDRFCIRQFLKKSSSAAQHDKPVTSNSADHEVSVVDHNVNVAPQDPDIEETRRFAFGHDPADMLKKKEKRGVPTPAQKYFTGLVRDAAKASKLWKKAAPLNESFDRKKEDFLSKMFETCPSLKPYRREVVRRLIDALQNRRKYLCDKCCGRRKPKSKVISSDCASTSIEKGTDGEHGIIFKEGNSVKILSRSGDQGEVIGKGIYSGKTAGEQNQFCQLIVVSVMQRAAELQLELPKHCDSETIFTKNVIKKIITWRLDRIKPDVPSGKKSTSTGPSSYLKPGNISHELNKPLPKGPVKRRKQRQLPDFNFVSSTDIESSNSSSGDYVYSDHDNTCTSLDSYTGSEDIDSTSEMPTLSTPRSTKKRKVCVNPTATSTPKAIKAKISKVLDGDTVIQGFDDGSVASSSARACLYEWGGGKVYLGALVNGEGFTSVINCMKPIAKFKDGEINVIVNDPQSMVLNKMDKQNDPDNTYQICVMPSSKVYLNEKGGSGHIVVTCDVQKRLKGMIKHYLETKSSM